MREHTTFLTCAVNSVPRSPTPCEDRSRVCPGCGHAAGDHKGRPYGAGPPGPPDHAACKGSYPCETGIAWVSVDKQVDDGRSAGCELAEIWVGLRSGERWGMWAISYAV